MGIIKRVASKIKSAASKIGPAVQSNNYGTGTNVGGTTVKSTGPTQTTTGSSSSSSSSSGSSSRSSGGTFVSGGGSSGGGSSGVPSTTQSNLENPTLPAMTSDVNANVQQDTGPVNTVTPGVSNTGIRNAANYFRENIKYDDPYSTIKGTAQIATGGIRERKKQREEVKFQKEVQQREGRFIVSQEDKIKAFKGYSGTAENYRYEQTPTEVLIRDASLGDQASLIALRNRYEVENAALATREANKRIAEDKSRIDNYTSQLQILVNEGKITYEQATQEQKSYASKLDELRRLELEDKFNQRISNQQKTIDDVSKKGRITRLTLVTAGSLVAGAFVGPAIATAPKIVQTGGAVVAGASMVKPVLKTSKGLVQGTAGGLDVAELVLPAAGFVAGGAIGLKIAGRTGVQVDQKLNAAFETAQIKPVKTVKFTSESQIKALNIPEPQKVELLRKFNMGESVGYSKYELKNPNRELNNYLQKKLPDSEIISVGETSTLNNVYAGETLVRVKVGKGKYEYTDFTSGQTLGIYDAKTKRLYSQTVYGKAELGKPIREVGKTAEVTEIKVKNELSEGQLKRLIASETYSFEGLKVKSPQGGKITYKDLAEVVNAEKFERFPSARTRNVEIQKAVKANQQSAALLSEEGTGIGITGKEIKFVTEQAKGVTEKPVKPIEFTKKISKKIKYSDLAKDVDKTIRETSKQKTPKSATKQINKNMQEINQLEYLNVEVPNFQKQIKESVQEGVAKLNKKQNVEIKQLNLAGLNFNQEELQKINKNVLESPNLNLEALNKNLNKNKNKEVSVFSSPSISPGRKEQIKIAQIPNVIQIPKQIQVPKQELRELQTTDLFQPLNLRTPTPSFRVPKIDIPKPTMPRIPKQESASEMVRKYLKANRKQRQPKYTASLGAAAFQAKPFQVTKKQYQQLSKRTYTGAETRPVLEIVDEDSNKVAKKVVESVKF